MSPFDVVMAVPRTVVELHEANAFLDEFSRQQTLSAECVGGVLADAVQLLCRCVFFGKVENFGDLHLHSKRELITLHACDKFVMTGMQSRMSCIEF